MEINDELIRQWEPKIHKMLQTTYVRGYDREDLAQELRMAIMKAAKAFNPNRGTIFHTYLHTTMVNTIRTLITKAQRKPITVSYDENFYDNESDLLPETISKAISPSHVEEWETLELKDQLDKFNLTDREKRFIELRLEGWTMDEISEDLTKSAYRIRQKLRVKVETIFYGEETEEEKSI
jgi:RNA polymerase sigma factor (sigma-70 family)